MTTKTTEQETAQEAPQSVQDATEAAQEAPDAPEPAEAQDDAQEHEEQAEDEPQDDKQGKLLREAQKLRKRLREAEAQRDQLTTERDVLRRAVVESHLSRGMTSDAFWAAGHDPATLFGEDGSPNHQAILDAEQTTRRRFNIAGTPKPDPSQGMRGGNPGNARTEWTNAFDRRA